MLFFEIIFKIHLLGKHVLDIYQFLSLALYVED